MRGAEENQEKQIYGAPHISSSVVRERKKGKKGKKEGKKGKKEGEP